MRYLPFIICFICAFAFAGDYVRFDKDGVITNKYESVDGSDIKDDPDIIRIDRDTFDSLTIYHWVKNGVVVEMSQSEKDAEDIKIEADKRQTIIDKIENLEITFKEFIDAWTFWQWEENTEALKDILWLRLLGEPRP